MAERVHQLHVPLDGADGPITSVELQRLPTVGDVLNVQVTIEPPQLDGEAMLPMLGTALCLPPKVVEQLHPYDAYRVFGALIELCFSDAQPNETARPVGRYARVDRGATTVFPLSTPIKVLAEEQAALAYCEPTLKGMAKIKLSHLVAANPLDGVTYAMMVPLYQQTLGVSYQEALSISWYDAIRLSGVLLPLAFAPGQATGGRSSSR